MNIKISFFFPLKKLDSTAANNEAKSRRTTLKMYSTGLEVNQYIITLCGMVISSQPTLSAAVPTL